MTSLAAVRQLIAAEKSVVIRHTKDADGADGGTLTIGRVVLKRNASHRCTVYELFDAKTDAFLLSCIAKDEAKGWVGYGLALAAATVGGTRAGGGGGSGGGSGGGGSGGVIFTTLRDLDQRAYEDVSTSAFCASYLGTLVPQGWGGRTWTLFVSSDSRGDGDSRIDGARHAAIVATSSSSGPASAAPHCTISFDPSFSASPVQFSLSTPYMRCRSKMPLWNTELGSYVHNFGCRVKVSSHRNFVCTGTAVGGENNHHHNQKNKGQATINPLHAVVLRHGKVSSSEYVLDFRDPLTPLVALAVFCAVHAKKPLVTTGP